MSCGYYKDEIGKILLKHVDRKTIPKKDVIKIIKLFASSVKYQEHLPGCYLPGQTPPTLSNEHLKENELIKTINGNTKEQLEKILNLDHVKQTRKRFKIIKLWKDA